jgi:hypothetical protein
MRVASRTGRQKVALLGGLIAAASPALAAVWLFVDVASGNGSNAGDILRVGFGILLILVSVLVFGVGAIYLKASGVRPEARTGAQS